MAKNIREFLLPTSIREHYESVVKSIKKHENKYIYNDISYEVTFSLKIIYLIERILHYSNYFIIIMSVQSVTRENNSLKALTLFLVALFIAIIPYTICARLAVSIRKK